MAGSENTTPLPESPPLITQADINTTINGEPRILDLRLAEALGFKRSADIRPLIERHREALERLGGVFRTVRKTSPKGGRPTNEYWLTKKQAIYITTKAETAGATEITIAVVEVFDAATSGAATAASLSSDESDLIGHYRRMTPGQQDRLRLLAVAGDLKSHGAASAPGAAALPPPEPAPPFCTGCMAKVWWKMGGINQERHPLKDRPIDQTDMKVIAAVRDVIEEGVKEQTGQAIKAAIAALNGVVGRGE